MTRKSSISGLVILAAAAGYVACADLFSHAAGEPTSSVSPASTVAPASTRPASGPTLGVEPRGKPMRPNRGPPPEDVNFTPEQWKSLDTFMATNSPRKWEMVRSLPEKNKRQADFKQNIRQNIARRYRSLEQIREADQERYAFEITSIRVEDKIYGILKEMRSTHDADENDSALRTEVGELIDNRANWRKIQVERIERQMKDLGLNEALTALKHEEDREEANRKKRREDQLDRRVAEFKDRMFQQRPGKFGQGDRNLPPPPGAPSGGRGPGSQPQRGPGPDSPPDANDDL